MDLYAIVPLAKLHEDHDTAVEYHHIPLGGSGDVFVKITFRHHIHARTWVARTGAEPLPHPALNSAVTDSHADRLAQLEGMGIARGDKTWQVAQKLARKFPTLGWEAL